MISKKKKKVFAKIQSGFSAEIQHSKVFSAQNYVISKKKKKKRSSPKFRAIFLPISQVQTFEGGSFRMGGQFSIFHRKSASKAQRTCDFAYFTSQWGGSSSPRPPWLRYCVQQESATYGPRAGSGPPKILSGPRSLRSTLFIFYTSGNRKIETSSILGEELLFVFCGHHQKLCQNVFQFLLKASLFLVFTNNSTEKSPNFGVDLVSEIATARRSLLGLNWSESSSRR